MRQQQQQNELLCIDLTGEVESPSVKRSACLRERRSRGARRSSRRRDDDSDGDDDVVVVKTVDPKGKKRGRSSAAESQACNAKQAKSDEHTLGEEEDFAIVGTAGQDILRDLPHQRPDCAEHSFSSGACCRPNAQHCAQCFCFVCDVKASECCAWGSGTSGRDHCNAFKTDEWKRQRNLARQNGRPRGPDGAAKPSPPQAARTWPSSRPRLPPHPVQAQPPPRSSRDQPAAAREAPAARERRDAADALAALAASAPRHAFPPTAAGRHSAVSSLHGGPAGGARPQYHRPPYAEW